MNRISNPYRMVLLSVVVAMISGLSGTLTAAKEGAAPAKPIPTPTAESAVPKPGTDAVSSRDLKTYPLRFADQNLVLNVLSDVLAGSDVRLTFDPKQSRLIVFGSPEEQQKVVDVLSKLDVQGPKKESQIKVFKLLNADPASTAAAIAALKLDARLAVDERTRSIIATADSPNVMSIVDALVERLEFDPGEPKHLGCYEVRVVWLSSGLPDDKPGEPPAEDLKDVVVELSRLGVKNPCQVGKMVVRTTGNVFNLKSSPNFEGHMAEFTASGVVSEQPHGELLVKVDIKAGIAPLAQGQSLGDVNTQLVMPQKQFVVLAMTPVGKRTAAFVVQVTSIAKAEEKKDKQ